ncbi:MAG: 3-hydroxyacyl-CoA dehydrogenase [Burkholderiaceae bacterium]|nr:3-hydroxyacyl-CoA dehydrogenase [Burkholderiaceae bacterium]
MGSGVAVVFLAGGWAVDVVSPTAATRDSLAKRVGTAMQRIGKEFDASMLAVHADYDSVPWDRITIAVENVNENLELKQKVFADLVRRAQPGTPLTSNSSSYPISEIGQGLPTQERMMGLHFYMPAFLVPLVEIVRAETTDVAVAERVGEWMWALGKRPVQVRRDIPGFLANRIQHALIRESVNMLEMGIASAEDIDAAIRYSFGFRLAAAGPLMQREHAGWDMSYSVARSLYPDLSNMDAPPPVIEKMVQAGNFGMKSGQGLHPWNAESIAKEKERYEQALQTVLAVFEREGLR